MTHLSAIAFASLCSLSSADQSVYTNSLAAGWDNWSWDTTISFSATAQAHSASNSISAQYTGGWAGMYFHSSTPGGIPTSGVNAIHFWAHSGVAASRPITFAVYDASGNQAGSVGLTVTNTWTLFQVSLSQVGSPSAIGGLVWQNNSPSAQPVYYIDDITLISPVGPTPTPEPPGAGPALTVNVATGRHTISPYIYGMNFAPENLADELDLPVNRFGGNSTTRYSWQNDTSNRASDWYFENIPNDNDNVPALPTGSSSDKFVEQDRRTGTSSIITTTMIGWTPRDREFRSAFSVAKYGAQTGVDPWRPDMGNGIRSSNGQPITGNDPLDTSVAVGPQYTRDWIAHLTSRFGNAAAGGVKFYALDNEPELWSSTHRDLRPQRLSYDELRSLTETYGAAIKAQDPTALTVGPCSWGWTAYFYSDLDSSAPGQWWLNPLDRNAHGGVELNAWYLARMRDYEIAHGTRILDYFDLHYYPQATGVSLSPAGNQTTQALRLRSTRSLWDPTYVDESWIADEVMLIPRMKQWVAANYPGTKMAMTEYNWGAIDHINGAVAQADVLGIFGREGLDMATIWDTPETNEPTAYAFRMYRNYNGSGGRFGNMAVTSTSANQERVSIYGAQRVSDNALTLMVVNKDFVSLTSTITLSNFTASGPAQAYRYSSANLNAIQQLANVPLSGNTLTSTFPQQSITLFVVPTGTAPENPPASSGWILSDGTNNPVMSVGFTASDDVSGVASTALWVRRPGDAAFASAGLPALPGTTGSFAYTAAAGDGVYQFYTRSTDNYGLTETAPATADDIITLDTVAPAIPAGIVRADSNTTSRDAVEYTITFSEPVAPSLVPGDIELIGTLAGVATTYLGKPAVDPLYRVIVALNNPDQNGTVGIRIAGSVSDQVGNTLTVPVAAPLYTVTNFPKGDVNKDGTVDLADVARLADANLGLVTLP